MENTNKKNELEPFVSTTMEDYIKMLNDIGIETQITDKDEFGFSRTIKFKIYDITYKIIWYINQSTLEIGEGIRPAQIPFKYIYYDRTFPLVGGNKSIGFSFVKFKKKSIFDREFPYEVFRIPIPIN